MLPLTSVLLAAILFPTTLIQTACTNQAQVMLQSTAIAPGGSLRFTGQDFFAGESAIVTIEDGRGHVQAGLSPVVADSRGHLEPSTIVLPEGVRPGPHSLGIRGQASGRLATADFRVVWNSPTLLVEAYASATTETFGFSGTGFVPSESVDLLLAQSPIRAGTSHAGTLVVTATADDQGDVIGRSVPVPTLASGAYTLTAIGRVSQTPAWVGFDIRGFQPELAP